MRPNWNRPRMRKGQSTARRGRARGGWRTPVAVTAVQAVSAGARVWRPDVDRMGARVWCPAFRRTSAHCGVALMVLELAAARWPCHSCSGAGGPGGGRRHVAAAACPVSVTALHAAEMAAPSPSWPCAPPRWSSTKVLASYRSHSSIYLI